jgi:hypothetical protein
VKATSLLEHVPEENDESTRRWTGKEPAWRSGVNGGRQRFGDSGGQHREYYRLFYRAKKNGEEAFNKFIEDNGHPPKHR